MRPEYRSHFTANVAVERIEPKLRLTLGLPAQFASERRKFQRRAPSRPPAYPVVDGANRLSSPSSQTRSRSGPFAPPELPGFPATMSLSGSRCGLSLVMSSQSQSRSSSSPYRVSQVPRPTFRRAPPSSTPTSPAGSLARCSPAGGRLHPLWRVGRLALCVTRPIQVRSRCGSRLRSAGLRLVCRQTHRPLRYLLNEQFAG
jgi:hypothetical protein